VPGWTTSTLDLAAHALLAIGERAVTLVLTQPEQHTPERWGRLARTMLRALSTPPY